jgi:hypothetical protein
MHSVETLFTVRNVGINCMAVNYVVKQLHVVASLWRTYTLRGEKSYRCGTPNGVGSDILTAVTEEFYLLGYNPCNLVKAEILCFSEPVGGHWLACKLPPRLYSPVFFWMLFALHCYLLHAVVLFALLFDLEHRGSMFLRIVGCRRSGQCYISEDGALENTQGSLGEI